MPDLICCAYKELNCFDHTFKTDFFVNNFVLVRHVLSV